MNDFLLVVGVCLLSSTFVNGDDSCSELEYYNPSDTYTASYIVTYGHYLSDKDFCKNEAYLDEIMTVPIVIACIYIVMLLCFLAGMSGRVYYQACKCRPPKEDNIEYEKQRAINLSLFYILCCLVLVLDQLVFIGNYRIDLSIKTLSGATSSVQDATQEMKTDSQTLFNLGSVLSTEYTAAAQTCSGSATTNASMSYLDGNITAYTNAMSSYTTSLTPISDFLNDVEDDIQVYGVVYRSIALYIIWALAILFTFGVLHYNRVEFRYGLKLTMGIGVIVYALYALLSFPWTYSTSLLADFCVFPSYNAVKSLPTRDSLQEIGVYYSTCVGGCTLTDNYQLARDSVNYLNATSVALRQGECAGNAALLNMQNTLHSAQSGLDALFFSQACAPIQTQWFKFWNSGVCDDLYAGSFYVWGSQLLTSFFLFILIVCVSITYQFYPDLTQVYPSDPNKSKGPLEQGSGRGSNSFNSSHNSNSAVGDMMSPEEDPQNNLNRVLAFHEAEADDDMTLPL
uniref:Uncharacterized protein n=1 Tax=Spumella elongata TaxID=89044 RepID=A0A7S3LZ74_9STRA